eukprot:1161859-Pelagomonas_calceolata.AAC.20
MRLLQGSEEKSEHPNITSTGNGRELLVRSFVFKALNKCSLPGRRAPLQLENLCYAHLARLPDVGFMELRFLTHTSQLTRLRCFLPFRTTLSVLHITVPLSVLHIYSTKRASQTLRGNIPLCTFISKLGSLINSVLPSITPVGSPRRSVTSSAIRPSCTQLTKLSVVTQGKQHSTSDSISSTTSMQPGSLRGSWDRETRNITVNRHRSAS